MLRRVLGSIGALIGRSVAVVVVGAVRPAQDRSQPPSGHTGVPRSGSPPGSARAPEVASSVPEVPAPPARIAIPRRSAGVLGTGRGAGREGRLAAPSRVVGIRPMARSSAGPSTRRRQARRDTSAVLTLAGVALVLALSASYVSATMPGVAPEAADATAVVLDAPGGTAAANVAGESGVLGSRSSGSTPTALQPLGSPAPPALPTLPAVLVPSLAPEPTPSPAAGAPATATPRPAINRRDFLKKCPGQPRCYVYTVQRGDNLKGVAQWWGVSVKSILELNPQIRDPRVIYRGNRIVLPPPGR
jgi:hypothetical protein